MNLNRKLIALLSAVALAAGGSVLVAPTASAATVNPFTVNPSRPMANEQFEAKGRLKTAEVRPVRLQRKSNGVWKTVETVTSSATGFYRTHGSTAVDRYFRIYVPAATVDGKARKIIKGTAKLVRIVGQTAKLTISDATIYLGQPNVTVTGTFSPARQNRPVLVFLGRKKDLSDLNQVDSGLEDQKGKFTFTLPDTSGAEPGAFYIVLKAVSGGGVSGKSTNPVKFVIREQQ